MAAVQKILVQGGGVGGLTFAAALAQRGMEVDVVEAAVSDMTLGVGLNQPNNALAALDEIGVRDACLAIGFPFEELVFWSPDSTQVAALPPTDGVYGTPSNNAISRPKYNAILREAAQLAGAHIRTGETIVALSNGADFVDVEFGPWQGKGTPPICENTTDSARRYDLVVGFDGQRSRLRDLLYPGVYTPQFTGFAVWRITLPRPTDVTHIIMALAGPVKAVLTPTGEDSMYIALVSPEPGRPRYDPADFAALVRERMSPFTGRIGKLRDSITADSYINYAPLEYVTVREPWFRSRVAIAGDAAHLQPPHLAQGAAMAVEDAVTLAAALDEHENVQAALGAWYARRRDRAEFVADASLALLKNETGTELTAEEASLADLGIPGALRKLALEHY